MANSTHLSKAVKWFTKETFSNWLYDMLGTVWRSALMTAAIGLVIRFASTIPPDVKLVIVLFVGALVFWSLQRSLSKRNTGKTVTGFAAPAPEQPSAPTEKGKTVEELTEQLRLVTNERDGFERARDGAIKANEEVRTQLAKAQHDTETHYIRAEFNHQLLEKYKWLHELAERVKSDIQWYVLVTHCSISYHYIKQIDPYVIFTFSIFNASIYDISFDSTVEGYISFDNQRLGGNKELSCRIKVFSYGSNSSIKVIQHLGDGAAAAIGEAAEAQRGIFKLDTLVIRFSGKDIESTKLKLPEGVYTTGILYH